MLPPIVLEKKSLLVHFADMFPEPFMDAPRVFPQTSFVLERNSAFFASENSLVEMKQSMSFHQAEKLENNLILISFQL